ncbi:M20/M25/M40 family metallo-hydrolase, partial [Lactobacillus sp. XV13L]|nr:M20/M25/M40 family metallo-hydrolase [Lactobacillus sp. XV13L]
HKIVQLIQEQLNQNGFSDVQVEYLLGEQAGRTHLDDAFVQLNHQVAKQVYGPSHVKLIPNMPGAGPIKPFLDKLQVPVVMTGIHYAGSHPHSPNENIRLADYQAGTYYLINLLTAYGQDN